MHRIETVNTMPDYFVKVKFLGGVTKKYDMKQLFSRFPQFHHFEKDKGLFESAKVDKGGYGIVWNDELDLDAEVIWDDGILIEIEPETDINRLLAYQLLMAREKANMTQRQLAEKTGIYQADISKIERGIGNPSLSTIVRLADGLGMRLVLDFQPV